MSRTDNNSVTVLILTHNEEQHIQRCIESVKGFASDIVVVDSFSDDLTVDIAKSLGARVFKNSWTNYATQFQWGLDNTDIATEWVMRLDADEYLETNTEIILKELSKLSVVTTGVYIKRKYYFLGQWIKYGAMYPIYVLRIWRNGTGRIENRWMDEHIVLDHGGSTMLNFDIVDDNKNSVSWWIDKHNSYATREMVDILNNKYSFLPTDNALKTSATSQAKLKRILKEEVYSKLPIFVRPFLYFIYRYIFKLGFLDKKKGFAFHYMQGYWYRSLVDLKVLEAEELIGNERDAVLIKGILIKLTGLKL